MRNRILRLSLILVIAVTAVAQQRRVDESAPRIERLRTHITYLASDKLEGRRTGSPGADLAAEYIAKEFSRLGLRRSVGRDLPGMSILEVNSPRLYMQEFPYVSGVTLGKKNAMVFALNFRTPATAQGETGAPRSVTGISMEIVVGEEWMPLGFSSTASLTETPVTFVGYGIKADELNYDDYAGAQVSGRIAIALAGTPDGDNPHGQFARYEGVRWKAIAARNSGAAALVVIASETNFKDDRLSRLSYDNSSGEAGLPVVVISRQAAERILTSGGLPPLAKLQEATQDAFRKLSTPSHTRWSASVPVENVTLSIATDLVRHNAPAYNVVGILDGSDPVLRNEVIVIGAHYDHLGRGGEGSLAPRAHEIHHGADDNASGVAGVLELARIFSADRKSLKRTLVFIAFGGEEEGLLGSNYYVNHPAMPLAQTVAMINMDMIGRMKENKLLIGGVGTASEWRDLIAEANIVRGMNMANSGPRTKTQSGGDNQTPKMPIVISANGQPVVGVHPVGGTISVSAEPPKRFELTLNEDGFGPSDHSSFYAKQVPVLFFFTGTHDDYHKPTDTADKINYDAEANILSFLAGIVRKIDANAQRPAYAVAKSASQGRTLGFRVYLGTIPNYSESKDGLKLDGVREDSPAANAGLIAGDRIIKMAGREVRDVYDYTSALGEMKAGQEYEVEVVRGAETLKLKIIPAARK